MYKYKNLYKWIVVNVCNVFWILCGKIDLADRQV